MTRTRRRRTATGARWRLVTGLVAALALTGCTAATAPAAPTGPPPTPQARQLADAVTLDGAVAQLEALQRIADDSGGTRASGTPGYERSVDHVAGELRAAGFDVSTPTYEVDDDTTLRNVVAQTRTGDPGAVVVTGAHLDSVEDGPGINDDGTGVAALLETATRLGGSPEIDNAVRFAFWGSEEDNLQGSTGYVDGLSGAERDAILLYLNADMLGSPNGGYFVQGGAGDGRSETGPPGSATVARTLTEELSATGVTAETIPFVGDDDAPFVEAGIPTGGALTGDADRKTPEQARAWGGQAGEVFDRCYHSACDDLSNVNRTLLERYTTAIAGTVGRFATGAAERPSSG
ncbi:M20/M25/M40 family metallo-hydrolase [Pseudonocardia nantongensis]|uniref:M20/M25/M40 family metallo-hydrolase n=1 Tax=Pseudonocardia nantongensis TaxID=1181885 RepID=UPI00397A3CCF